MNRWHVTEGSPFPMGVEWLPEERAYNFALYSKHAHTVTLLFFTREELMVPEFEFHFDPIRNKSGPIWHCRISKEDLDGAHYYAYRVDGPNPGLGTSYHDFDPEKLLLDPRAKTIYFPPSFSREAANRPGDNLGHAALGVFDGSDGMLEFDWEDDKPVRHDSDLIIYEMHVRGFTKHSSSGVDKPNQGTFKGVIEKIPYLQDLGITAVELMPVFQHDPEGDDYWGYMPLNFFSPHHEYATSPGVCSQHEEFRAMVKALHDANIEVILDVVFNHTAEGDQRGPNYCFKGIDNTSYYILTGDSAHPYANYSGTGNTLHTHNRAVRQLIIDSLCHWVEDAHVDGFRFDLASVFTRREDGSVGPDEAPIFGEIASHPALQDIRLIAEPWDAYGLFQLGRHFPGTLWMQWNAGFRDTLQRFVRGDQGLVPDLMSRIYGSADLFPDDVEHAYRPFQSVNYITSHDGFTLYDLVSYTRKNNWANGHYNTDGPDEYSANHGWEGHQDAPLHVVNRRKRQVKNFISILMISNGTPMFRMGDEFLNTQYGNNNPYNQDNETSWLNWNQLEEHPDMFRFFKQLIAFRKAHPSLSRSYYWRDDVRWHGSKERATNVSFQSQQLAFCIHGANENDGDIYVMINAGPNPECFSIYEGSPGHWKRIIDTAEPSPNDVVLEDKAPLLDSTNYLVRAQSVVILVRV